jgi:hypothetical protein
MQQAPTSGMHGSAEGDVAANATSFGRHLRAANKSPNTIKSYLEATSQFDRSFDPSGRRHPATSARPSNPLAEVTPGSLGPNL